ncbi:MAG: serine hydrolase domain-containing protein [Caldilineaceae bacterium]
MNTSQLAALINHHITDGGFAGAAVIAAQHGEIVIEEYAGYAAPDRPANATTLWPLASISKLYTAAMIMVLVERGVLTLNTLASHFFPQFAGDGREAVRLRHLLSHTAGMIYESPEMEARLIAQTPRAALVAEMLGAPLQFAPGSAFDYADYHFCLPAAWPKQPAKNPLPRWLKRWSYSRWGCRIAICARPRPYTTGWPLSVPSWPRAPPAPCTIHPMRYLLPIPPLVR